MKRCILSFTLILFTLPILTCSDLSENVNLPIARPGYAIMLLNLGYPDEVATAQPTLVDRFFSLFTKTAHAQTAPPAFISSATVRVIGADFGVIEQSFAGSPVTIMALQVPAGALWAIEVTAYVSPTDPSAAISFKGSTVANLAGGAVVSVPVVMSVAETKPIIPDFGHGISTTYLVKINDMSGAGFVSRAQGFFGFAAGTQDMIPSDVDFDNRGRIFIANTAANYGRVWRINSINDTNKVAIGNAGGPVTALAIDRTRRTVFYSTTTTLWRCDYDGNGNTQLFGHTGTNMWGLAVDESSGNLVIANGTGANVILYNPAMGSVIRNVNLGGSSRIYDALIKDNLIYITRYDGTVPANRTIVQYTLGLLPTGISLRGKPGGGDNLIGPYRFLAVTSRRFYLIDELDTSDDTDDRIVSFDDISGSGWQTFQSQSIGQPMMLYYAC